MTDAEIIRAELQVWLDTALVSAAVFLAFVAVVVGVG
jgi:predicted Co/Zn/Cd cation transporter (cation efflux family)